MPSSSPKQARTMAAAAHNPAFAKKVGIPQGVAKEFNQADAAKAPKPKAKPSPVDRKARVAALRAKPVPDMDGDGY